MYLAIALVYCRRGTRRKLGVLIFELNAKRIKVAHLSRIYMIRHNNSAFINLIFIAMIQQTFNYLQIYTYSTCSSICKIENLVCNVLEKNVENFFKLSATLEFLTCSKIFIQY